ncbi:hypothetical protein V5O48_008998 [Marasmius crinis-equi]|uniref:Uncharacterized protein n=1 Tax=Marasmius crinis-equi TaxID=585013 RepID=A0ABR3FCZ3_9AGAR
MASENEALKSTTATTVNESLPTITPVKTVEEAIEVILKATSSSRLGTEQQENKISALKKEVACFTKADQALKNMVRELQATLADLCGATPHATAPVDSLVMTASRKYPEYAMGYEFEFDPGDWASHLDPHAQLAEAIQREATGLCIHGVTAALHGQTVAYTATCTYTVVSDDYERRYPDGKLIPESLRLGVHAMNTLAEWPFQLQFVSPQKDSRNVITYKPGDLSHIGKRTLEFLSGFNKQVFFHHHHNLQSFCFNLTDGIKQAIEELPEENLRCLTPPPDDESDDESYDESEDESEDESQMDED